MPIAPTPCSPHPTPASCPSAADRARREALLANAAEQHAALFVR